MTEHAATVVYTPPRGPPRRLRFRGAGLTDGPRIAVDVWNGCRWVHRASLPVSELFVECEPIHGAPSRTE